MLTVGIRELKQHASELIRKVREQGSPVQITYHGNVVAMLIPVGQAGNADEEKRAWAELDELAAQIGQRWPLGVSAQEAIDEDRS